MAGCKQELYSGLTEKDVNEMISILMHSGIETGKVPLKNDLYALTVNRGELSRAVEILKDHGYPRDAYQSMGDIFKKEGLISSPLEERVRFIYALSQNVEETLSQIDGVITARVHIVLPENNPFGDVIKPSSASVFIKYHPDSSLEEAKADIKLIVEKSIEGLSYDKVTVVMLPSRKVGALANGSMEDESVIPGSVKLLLLGILLSVAGFFGIRWLSGRQPDTADQEEQSTAQVPVGSPLMKMSSKEEEKIEADSNAQTLGV